MGSNINPSNAIINISEASGNIHKWLSGVPWLTKDNIMNIQSTCGNVANKSYRDSNILQILWSEFGRSNQWFGANTIFKGIPNKNTVADINNSDSPLNQFAIGSTPVVSVNDNAKVSVFYYDPHGSNASAISNYTVDRFRVDTYDPENGTTDLVENFSGETYRFTKNVVDSFLFNKNVEKSNVDWNSTLNIASAVGGELSLQIGYNNLIYPTKNYVGTQPSGPNYAGLAGVRTYYRLFKGTGPFNGGRIIFEGLSNALNEVRNKTNIEVYLHLPGVTTYQFGGGFENGNIFQDLGIFQNVPGGCLANTGGSGNYIDFSFGTISSSLSNFKCFIKVKIKNSNVTLNRITFSPTYA